MEIHKSVACRLQRLCGGSMLHWMRTDIFACMRYSRNTLLCSAVSFVFLVTQVETRNSTDRSSACPAAQGLSLAFYTQRRKNRLREKEKAIRCQGKRYTDLKRAVQLLTSFVPQKHFRFFRDNSTIAMRLSCNCFCKNWYERRSIMRIRKYQRHFFFLYFF